MVGVFIVGLWNSAWAITRREREFLLAGAYPTFKPTPNSKYRCLRVKVGPQISFLRVDDIRTSEQISGGKRLWMPQAIQQPPTVISTQLTLKSRGGGQLLPYLKIQNVETEHCFLETCLLSYMVSLNRQPFSLNNMNFIKLLERCANWGPGPSLPLK